MNKVRCRTFDVCSASRNGDLTKASHFDCFPTSFSAEEARQSEDVEMSTMKSHCDTSSIKDPGSGRFWSLKVVSDDGLLPWTVNGWGSCPSNDDGAKEKFAKFGR